MDPETLTNSAAIPEYFKALINIVGFLIAATAFWYAYFIKGKKEAQTTAPPVLSYDKQLIRIGDELSRIATAIEQIGVIVKRNADEEEIARRVEERLAQAMSARRRKPHEDEN